MHAWKHSVDVHPLMRTFWRRVETITAASPSLPPPLIRHMVWSMFGSGELMATSWEQNTTKILATGNTAWWQSPLSLLNTALALWMRKHWRYEIHGRLSGANEAFQIWIVGLGRVIIRCPELKPRFRVTNRKAFWLLISRGRGERKLSEPGSASCLTFNLWGDKTGHLSNLGIKGTLTDT